MWQRWVRKGMMKGVEILNGKNVNGGESEDRYGGQRLYINFALHFIRRLLAEWRTCKLSLSARLGLESLKLRMR